MLYLSSVLVKMVSGAKMVMENANGGFQMLFVQRMLRRLLKGKIKSKRLEYA